MPKVLGNLLIFRIMPTYISMLRGINVGGHKRIKMDQLRKSFEALGFEQVKTYIQSGNVVFSGGRPFSPARSSEITAQNSARLGLFVSCNCRTPDVHEK